MDKKTLDAISIAIERGIAQRMAEAERWLTADELIAQFGCFSKSWLKNYGHLLPRTQAVVTEPDGSSHASAWCYPMHKINRMLHDNSIKHLKLL